MPINEHLYLQCTAADHSQNALSLALGDVSWPPLSPDLTAADFFLWGYSKEKMFSNRL